MRYVKLVSVIAALVLALAACGDDGGDSDDSADDGATTEETSGNGDEAEDESSNDGDIAGDALLEPDDLGSDWTETQGADRDFVDNVVGLAECEDYVTGRVPPDESDSINFRGAAPDNPSISQWVDVYTEVEDAETSFAAVADNDMAGCLEALFLGEGITSAEGRDFDVDAGEEAAGYEVDLEDSAGDTGTFYLVVMRDDRVIDQLNIGLVSENERDEIIDAAAEKLGSALGD